MVVVEAEIGAHEPVKPIARQRPVAQHERMVERPGRHLGGEQDQRVQLGEVEGVRRHAAQGVRIPVGQTMRLEIAGEVGDAGKIRLEGIVEPDPRTSAEDQLVEIEDGAEGGEEQWREPRGRRAFGDQPVEPARR